MTASTTLGLRAALTSTRGNTSDAKSLALVRRP
jgi:hypothetical protein